ncbi:hypothetical protein LCGC14_1022290, partial [marine sediment metagenome]
MNKSRITEVVGQFTRIVQFSPAWDKRHADPDKNYGVNGVELRVYLQGPLGTIQFVLSTNWMLAAVQTETDAKRLDERFPYLLHKPQPTDIGYHSPKPTYEGHKPLEGKCEFAGGGPCYYDGSSLQAEEVFVIFCRDGLDGLWAEMEE